MLNVLNLSFLKVLHFNQEKGFIDILKRTSMSINLMEYTLNFLQTVLLAMAVGIFANFL